MTPDHIVIDLTYSGLKACRRKQLDSKSNSDELVSYDYYENNSIALSSRNFPQ